MTLTWLVWRQTRLAILIATASLVAFTLLILINGSHLLHAYQVGLARCRAAGDCADLQKQLFHGEGTVIEVINLTIVAPVVLGMFLGAPLVARELEQSTNKLIWTQGITRRRWFVTKLAWLALISIVWSAAIAGLVTWWSGPLNALGHQRFWPGQFEIQGFVPAAYALFAFALAAAASTIARRTVVAIGITIAGFVGLRLLISDYLRARYLRPMTAALKPGPHAAYAAQGNWTLNVRTNIATRTSGHGHTLPHLIHAGCHVSHFACLAAAGIRQLFTYQPATRYWTFQSIEALLYLAVAGLLIAASLTVLRRIDG